MKTFFSKRISFKNLLTVISLMVVLIILLIVSNILYINIKSYISEKMDTIDTNKLNQCAFDIDSSFTNVSKTAVYLQNNKQLISLIKKFENPSTSMYDRYEINLDISFMLSNIKKYNDIIKSINIISAKNQYDCEGLIFNSSLVDTIIPQNNKEISFHYSTKSLIDENPSDRNDTLLSSLDTFSYFRFSLFDENGFYGDAFIILDDNFLESCSNSMDSVLLLDNTLNVLYSGTCFDGTDTQSIKDIASKNNSKVIYMDDNIKIYRKDLNFHSWTALYLVKMNKYTKQFNTLRTILIISFLVCLIISFVFSGIISRKILTPVFKLTELIKKYKTDGFNAGLFEENRKKSRFSLREKIFYYFIITILLPITAFVGASYLQSNKIMNKQISQSYFTVFEKAANNVTKYMQKKQNILNAIVYNSLVQNYITQQDKPDIGLVNDLIEQSIYLGLDRDTISIYDHTNHMLISNRFRPKKRINESYFNNLKNAPWGMHWSMDTDELNRTNVSVGMPIVSILKNTTQETIGYAKIDIDYTFLSELFSELQTETNDIFLVDQYGKIITSSNKYILGEKANLFDKSAGIHSMYISGEKHMLFYKKLGVSQWYLVSKSNYSNFTKQSSIIFLNNIYIFIIILLFVTVLSYYISLNLLTPVNNLNILFEKLDIENFGELAAENYYIDEINDLGINFNKMVERLEDLIDELMIANAYSKQLEIEKKSAEIVALQAQINPHFLYNTLDTIIYMVKEGHKENAVTMIKSLSSLFRYGISRGEMVINIKEEIAYAKAYTNIMSFRYNNRINFIWNIDENIHSYTTIKLILQPVIENAIYHGIKNGKGTGTIQIECKNIDDFIRFTVKDDGKGIPEDDLLKLKEDLENENIENKVGIFNVQSRIRLHYGEKRFSVNISSIFGEGTTVTLTIPKVKSLQ